MVVRHLRRNHPVYPVHPAAFFAPVIDEIREVHTVFFWMDNEVRKPSPPIECVTFVI